MRFFVQQDCAAAEPLFIAVSAAPGDAGRFAQLHLAILYTEHGRPPEALPLLARLIETRSYRWVYPVITQAKALTLCQDPAAPLWVERAKEEALQGEGSSGNPAARMHLGHQRTAVGQLLAVRGDHKGAARFRLAAERA